MTLLDSTRPEINPASEDWGYLQVDRVSRGLNVSLRPELLRDEELVVANNIRFDRDNALVDLGYVKFGGVVRGNPRATFQFFLKNGSSILTLITNDTFYRWDETNLEWQYPSDGTKTTVNGAVRASAVNLLTETEALDNADWSQTGTMTITADTTVAPDTLTTADTIDDTDAAVNSYISQSIDISGVSGFDTGFFQFSFYAQAGTSSIVGIEVALSGGSTPITRKGTIDVPSTLSSSTGIGHFSGVDVGGGWWRIDGIVTNNGTGNDTLELRLYPAPVTTVTNTWVVTTTGTMILWGAQIEVATSNFEVPVAYEPVDDPINITVASITGFSDTDFTGITLADGTQHKTTINGAPSGSVIVLTDKLLGNVSNGAAFVKAVDLTGSDDIAPSITTWAAFDKMYFTNGSDTPKEFDGTDVSDISNLPTTPFTCRVLSIFKNHLMLMYTVESGTALPQRVRWSNPGSDSNFNASVNQLDLYDSEDWIVASESLGDFHIIYKERSIYRVEFLGLEDQRFQFTRVVDAEGALNQDAVINLGDEHLFMGNSNIYIYDGGFDITPIGDNIFEKIFSSTGDLSSEFAHRSFGIYVEELDEAWWFYPSGSDEFPMNSLRVKVATRAWSIREFPIQITGFGFFQSQNDLTWNTISGTWESQLFPWVGRQAEASAPTLHLCSSDQDRVYEYNYQASDDDGTAISYEVVTKDYYVPNIDMRFDRYEFFLTGTSILIEASYDFGESWVTLGTVSPGTVFIRQRLFKQQVGRSIRFRFTGSNQFGLGWFGFSYKMENILDF